MQQSKSASNALNAEQLVHVAWQAGVGGGEADGLHGGGGHEVKDGGGAVNGSGKIFCTDFVTKTFPQVRESTKNGCIKSWH